MADAFLYNGFTIEYDESLASPRLYVEGQLHDVERTSHGFASFLADVSAGTLLELGQRIVDAMPEQQKRAEARGKHLDILARGDEQWNAWRREAADVSPLLYDASLPAIFSGREPINFSNTDLRKATFPAQANLTNANFHQANLARATLDGADLTGANFCRTDLYETKLRGAKLIGANLQGTQLAKTDFSRAEIVGCRVYGMAAWDVTLTGATQRDLIIRYHLPPTSGYPETTGELIVDDLQLAQFVYLLLNNSNLRAVIDTIGQKGVLILGRFSKERRPVLEVIRDELRACGYIPMLFDFEKPNQRDFTETVQTLAGMSLFIVADITRPRSVPLELQAIVPNYMVPLVPIFDEREDDVFSMFTDLRLKYPQWVLDPFAYDSLDSLRTFFRQAIVDRAVACSGRLVAARAGTLHVLRAVDYGSAPS